MTQRLPKLLLWLLIGIYVLQFGALSISRHDAFLTHMRDLGNMDQPIWNTLQGRFLEETKGDGRLATRLTDHVEPIFALVSLVFLLWDDVRALLLLQTVVIAVGALPVYWLARDRLGRAGPWAGLAFAAAYLLHPALQAANLAEFHAVPLAVPLLLFAYYYGRHGQAGGFWIASLLALATKEDVALITFMLGLYLAWKGPRRAWGLLLAGVSLAWFGVTVFVVIPAFGRAFYAGLDNSAYFSRYGELGSGPRDIVLNLLRQPLQVLGTLVEPARLRYIAYLLAPVGFLALLDPLTALIALPPLLLNMLSNYPAMYSGQMHYSAPIVPFVIAGAIGGAGRLCDWLKNRLPARPRLSSWVAPVMAAWVLVFAFGSQVTEGYSMLSLRYQPAVVTAHQRLLSRFAGQIPPTAALSTTPPLFPHFSHRQRIYEFPLVGEADYVLLDVSGTTDMHPNDVHQAYVNLLDQGFGVLDAADGYILLLRGAAGSTLPDAFYSFVRIGRDERYWAAPPAIQHRYEINFGETLLFLGFDVLDDARWQLTRIRTYWQVLRRPEGALHPYPFFMNAAADIVEDTSQRPPVGPLWYPASQWQPGDLLQVDTLPWDLGDEFLVGIGVLAGDNWTDPSQRLHIASMSESDDEPARAMDGATWARLATLARQPAWEGGMLRPLRMADDAHPPAGQQNLLFGEQVELLGYHLDRESERAGAARRLTLYWRARSAVPVDYTVFVHVKGDAGASLSQEDGGPNWRGPLPTTSWLPGEIVPDTRTILVPADAPAGRYRITIGLYNWQTMERLAASDAAGAPLGDEVELTTIEVVH